MLAYIFCLFSTLVAVLGAGNLIILSQPKSIIFKGHERLDETILKELYSAALGFTIEQDSTWSGMYLVDPFNLAKAIVTVYVDGVNDIGSDMGHSYPLHTNELEENIWNTLEKRIHDRYPNIDANLIRLELNDGIEAAKENKVLNKVKSDLNIKTKYLTSEDQSYLNEVGLLNNIADEIDNLTPSDSRDVYWFVIHGLHELSDIYGTNSTQTIEAKEILVQVLNKLNSKFQKVYNGNVLFTIVTTDMSHTRIARSILEEKETPKANELPANLNLAQIYSGDYPVIFNIILWFGVAMFFALLAICLAIGSMDPGRDSIIYRMTSNRMKKDN